MTAGGGQWADLGLRLSYRHTLPPSRSFQISGKVGARGMEVELDSRRSLPRKVSVKTALRLGDRGVVAVFSLQGGGMVFEFPVLLSAVFTGWTLSAGGLIPALADLAVGWLVSSALGRRAERLRVEGEPLRRRQLLRAWKEAANQARLMVQMANRRTKDERDKGGMVILRARYGSKLSTDCGERWWTLAPWDATLADHSGGGGGGTDGVSGGGTGGGVGEGADGGSAVGAAIAQLVAAPNVDVTVPLQFFVKDSTLSLPHGSKARLLGFYTPEACRPPPAPIGRSQRSDREGWGGHGQAHGAGSSGQSGERDTFWRFGFGGEEGGGDEDSVSPVAARLYIRYQLAGRTFEESFDDIEEVNLPSPTATYMGGLGVH